MSLLLAPAGTPEYNNFVTDVANALADRLQVISKPSEADIELDAKQALNELNYNPSYKRKLQMLVDSGDITAITYSKRKIRYSRNSIVRFKARNTTTHDK